MNLLKTLIFLVSALAVGCTSDQMIEEEAKPFDIKEPSIKVDGVKEGYVVYLHKKEEAYENKASSPV